MSIQTHLLATRFDTPLVREALSHDGITHLSAATTWKLIERTPNVFTFGTLDTGVKVAHEEGKGVTTRIRGGQSTPDNRKGRTITGAPGTHIAGLVVPCPCNTQGKPNPTLMTGFKTLVAAYAEWADASLDERDGITHLTWPGGRSAEIYVSTQMMKMKGCTAQTVGAAHVAFLNAGAAMPGTRPIEFSISGMEQSAGEFREVQNMIIPAMRQVNTRRAQFTQRNGFGDSGPVARSPDPTIPYGVQMVKAFKADGKTPFDASAVYDRAEQAQADYIEVYVESFDPTRPGNAAAAARWYAEAAAHAA